MRTMPSALYDAINGNGSINSNSNSDTLNGKGALPDDANRDRPLPDSANRNRPNGSPWRPNVLNLFNRALLGKKSSHNRKCRNMYIYIYIPMYTIIYYIFPLAPPWRTNALKKTHSYQHIPTPTHTNTNTHTNTHHHTPTPTHTNTSTHQHQHTPAPVHTSTKRFLVRIPTVERFRPTIALYTSSNYNTMVLI